MTVPLKCLLSVLALTLCSCKTLPSKPVAYLPPRIDCGEYQAPAKRLPADLELSERSVVMWQLHAFAWKDVAESLLEQRIATAACMQGQREAGNIR